jgi:hypothetical protein
MDMVIQFRGTIYEKGYGQVAQLVMRDKTLKPTAKAIYAYLCSFAWGGVDSDRKAFPTVKQQCYELGITKDTYYKHRSALEERGYITIESVYGGNGKFRNNLYYIESTPCPKNVEMEPPCPKKSDTRKPDTENLDTNIIIPQEENLKKDIHIHTEHAEKKEFQFYDWVNSK